MAQDATAVRRRPLEPFTLPAPQNHSIRADDGNLLMNFLDKNLPQTHDAIRGAQRTVRRAIERPHPLKQLAVALGAGDPLSMIDGPANAMAGVARTAKALPLDDASRMARAKEMGFTTDTYHGTTRVFDAFDPDLIGTSTDGGFYGKGV